MPQGFRSELISVSLRRTERDRDGLKQTETGRDIPKPVNVNFFYT